VTKFAAGIQYDGAAYCGWQRQMHSASVQQIVEEALSKIANEAVTVFCSGRTDTGVHAKEQLIHFETSAARSDYAWRMGCNSSMPKDIRVMWCHVIDDGFHARFSATARLYQYVIHNARSESALLQNKVNWVSYALNEDKMHQAAQNLVGEHDFTSFRASSCQANTPCRKVYMASVRRKNDFIFVDIQANAFLHHMVRNIVGSLIEVGKGEQEPQWIAELIELKDRKKSAVTALANGLYFIRADYPSKYHLAQTGINLDEPCLY